ncbi:MAG: dihydroneopterin aldolase, partial [Kiritimatiellae bacterium]|nr:dihydroneopterin aldolase [Kiritimatiellia bacterium]
SGLSSPARHCNPLRGVGMTLKLNGIDVDCVIGERPDERTRLQTLRVDVELEISDVAADSDSLSDTVDYAALTERIRAALASAKCRMIERAAKIVKDVCLSDAKVRAAKVSVTKSGAVPHLESAQAVL